MHRVIVRIARHTAGVWMLIGSIAAAQEQPTPALKALGQMQSDYATHFNWGIAYWAFGGALIGTGIVTMAVENPTLPTPASRLTLISGTATLVSGFSSCFSGLPLTLAPGDLARRVGAHGGAGSLTESTALDILREHAAWARKWRLSTLVVTTALLAVNAAILAWYSAKYEYERTTTAVVAGLYGLGVGVVPWYDSLPWAEETIYETVRAGQPAPAPSHALSIMPSVEPGPRGAALGVAVSSRW
jgi:hypothetical protein